MGRVNISENLGGLSGSGEMERALVKMQKQLNWALSNIDAENTSGELPSGGFITADGKSVIVTKGLITAIF